MGFLSKLIPGVPVRDVRELNELTERCETGTATKAERDRAAQLEARIPECVQAEARRQGYLR